MCGALPPTLETNNLKDTSMTTALCIYRKSIIKHVSTISVIGIQQPDWATPCPVDAGDTCFQCHHTVRVFHEPAPC